MFGKSILLVGCVLIGLTACSPAVPAAPEPTRAPVVAPTQPPSPTLAPAPTSSSSPPTTTPTVTRPPATPSATPEPKALRLTTSDGVELVARQWGEGENWAIVSSNGDGKSERWQPLAEALSRRGFVVLTFDWRGTNPLAPAKSDWTLAVRDAEAALAHAKSNGAKRIALIGSSLGGIASIKLGARPDVVAVVVVGSPYRAEPMGISAAEVKAVAAALTLFIGSIGDKIVPLAEVQWLHDQANEPRAIEIYPGDAHGVDLLSSAHRDEVVRLIVTHVARGMASSPTNTASEARAWRWREDLDALVDAIRRGHPKPFFKNNEAEFERAVLELRAAIPSLDDASVRAELMRIAAMFDGHTRIFFGQGAMNFRMYALRLYKFNDGLVVVDARAPNADLVGAKLIRIGEMDADEVFRRISRYAEHDNAAWIDFLTPAYMLSPELLIASGVISEAARPNFTFQLGSEVRVVNPEIVSVSDFRAWSTLFQLPARSNAAWLVRRAEPFWFTRLADDKVLYVQYNQIRPSSGGESISAFVAQIERELDIADVKRVIIDLRNNGGGDNTTFGPMLNFLQSPRVNGRGALFVLLGRNTFSAAANFATRVEQTTDAVFVGEPMGGSPNLYGDTRTHTLPNSSIEVWVSARYWQMSTPDDTRETITPTIAAPLRSTDWLAGRDPALTAALAEPRAAR